MATPVPTAARTKAPIATSAQPNTSPTATGTITTAVIAPGGSGGSGPTRGAGAGTGGNGGAVDNSLGGPTFPFASLSVPTPVFAWLSTTMGGILLFLFLVRRRPREDSPSLATFVLEGPTPPGAMPLPATIIEPPPIIPPPMASQASAGKATTAPKRTRTKKPAGLASAAGGLPAAAAAVAVASAFAKPPAKGVERVFVSYQGVRMAAMPDEFSLMLARLERGDEVEIVGSQDGYLNVRTPIGLTGWIPRVTVTSVRPSPRGGSTPALN